MHSTKKYVCAGIALLAIVLAFVWADSNRNAEPTDTESPAVQTEPKPVRADRAASVRPDKSFEPDGFDAPASDNAEALPETQTANPANIEMTREEVDAVLDELEFAALSYDAVELPVIESYLLHPDPEIREAALDAMLTLGDAAASPMLRAAAAQAYSPHEAVELLEAADFLELPSAILPVRESRSTGQQSERIRRDRPEIFPMRSPRDRTSAPTPEPSP